MKPDVAASRKGGIGQESVMAGIGVFDLRKVSKYLRRPVFGEYANLPRITKMKLTNRARWEKLRRIQNRHCGGKYHNRHILAFRLLITTV
jgi:hypothetical protein